MAILVERPDQMPPATRPVADPPAQRRRRRDLSVRVAIAISILFVVLGSVYPISNVLTMALSAEARPLYWDFITDPEKLRVLRHTLVLGLLVGVFGTAIGLLFAFVQARLQVPFKRFLHVIALVPIISPPFAVATATLSLFGRKGFVTHKLLGFEQGYDIYGLDGLVFVLSLSLFPVVYLSLLGMMRALDPAMEESAMIMGATRGRIFRTVTLPLLAPGLAGGFLLLFVEALADLANPLTVGGDYDVLASEIYLSFVGIDQDFATGAVYSFLLLVPGLAVFLAQRYWLGRKVRTTITGKPSGSVHLVTEWWRWPILGAALFIAALIVSLYGTVVAGAVTENIFVDGQNFLTLRHLKDVILGARGHEAMMDTITMAAIATPIAATLGLLISWLVVRHLPRAGGWLDFAGMLGIAIPGTVLGIGYLLAYKGPVVVGDFMLLPQFKGTNAVLGGAIAIVLVYITRSVPNALRAGSAALSQLDPYVEEASTSLGARPFQTFRWITLPLIRPAMFSALSYTFARSMTSISTIVFLATPYTLIMTEQILGEVTQSRYGSAFAYCTVLMAVVLAAFGLMRIVIGGGATLHRIAGSSERKK